MQRFQATIDTVIEKYTQELQPVRRSVRIRQQYFDYGVPASNTSLGNYFELMTKAFYGGILTNRRYLASRNGQQLKDN